MCSHQAGEERKIEIILDGSELGQVRDFKYLGQVVRDDGKCDHEIKRRIAIVQHFHKYEGCSDHMQTKMGYKSKASKVLCIINVIVWIRKLDDQCKDRMQNKITGDVEIQEHDENILQRSQDILTDRVSNESILNALNEKNLN